MRKGGGFLKFNLFLIIFLLILISGLTIHYLVNKKQLLSFVPQEFFLYCKTPSLKSIFEEYLHLEVVDTALSNPELSNIRKFVYSLRGSELLKNFFFKMSIDLPINIVMENEKQTLFIFDLGWRSIITRVLPLVGYNLNIENLSVIKKKELVIFQYDLGQKSSLFFAFVDNILLFSFNIDLIEKAYNRSKTSENFLSKKSPEIIGEISTKNPRQLKCLISLHRLREMPILQTYEIKSLISLLNFTNEAIISAEISETDINIELKLKTEPEEEYVKRILSSRFNYINALRLIPKDLSFISIINIANPEDILNILRKIDIKGINEKIDGVNSTLKTLFGGDIQELLLSWVGSEIGVYKEINKTDYVIFMKIRDESKFNAFLKKLLGSFVLEEGKPLEVEGVTIKPIKVPDFLQLILDIFKLKIPTAYHIEVGNYFFLSFDPLNISSLIKNFRSKTTFSKNEDFRQLIRNTTLYSGILFFYNLEYERPSFLQKENFLTEILNLYQLGCITMYQKSSSIVFNISSIGKRRSLSIFPGFPKKLDDMEYGTPTFIRLRNNSEPYLIYFNKDNALTVRDIELKTIFQTNFQERGEIILDNQEKTENIGIYFPGKKLVIINSKFEVINEKAFSDITPSFSPFFYKNKIYFFSKEEEKFFEISSNNIPIPLSASEFITAKPSIRKNYWAYYQQTFNGKIFLAEDLRLMEGWPVQTEGIGHGSLTILFDKGELKLYFINQNGMLYGWNIKGKPLENFPVRINDTFLNQGKPLKTSYGEALILSSATGKIYIVSPAGQILHSTIVPSSHAEIEVKPYDINSDKKEEIFVYNIEDHLMVFDERLNLLEDKIKGYYEPYFVDINNDGKLEVISVGTDKDIYIYTLNLR